MSKPPNTGFRRIINATRFSLAGLSAAWRNEAAFRQECLLALVLIPLGLWLGESPSERALLVGVVGVLLIVELINSAIEAVVDRVGAERHELAGRAKDLGSAAVMVSLLLAGAVWALVLWD